MSAPKSCLTCFHWPSIQDQKVKLVEGLPTTECKCSITNIVTPYWEGQKCKVFRARELGKPMMVMVETFETGPHGSCHYACKARKSNHTSGDYWCVADLMTKDGKPGPGCPRHKEEGE